MDMTTLQVSCCTSKFIPQTQSDPPSNIYIYIYIYTINSPLWRHLMEIFSTLLSLSMGELFGHPWIPLTNASDAELRYFIWSAPKVWVNIRYVGDQIWSLLHFTTHVCLSLFGNERKGNTLAPIIATLNKGISCVSMYIYIYIMYFATYYKNTGFCSCFYFLSDNGSDKWAFESAQCLSNIISMVKCETKVSPLLTPWRYCSLTLSHRYMSCLSQNRLESRQTFDIADSHRLHGPHWHAAICNILIEDLAQLVVVDSSGDWQVGLLVRDHTQSIFAVVLYAYDVTRTHTYFLVFRNVNSL